MGNWAAVEAEQPGLTIEQIRASAPPRSGFYLLRWILASEVAAGRVTERNGHYSLCREVWTADQVAALRELREVADA